MAEIEKEETMAEEEVAEVVETAEAEDPIAETLVPAPVTKGDMCIVYRVILEVLWHRLTLIEHLLNACVSDIACHNKRTLKVEACLDRILRENLANLIHTLIEVDVYRW